MVTRYSNLTLLPFASPTLLVKTRSHIPRGQDLYQPAKPALPLLGQTGAEGEMSVSPNKLSGAVGHGLGEAQPWSLAESI
ncbi:hypothetical protein FIBSPDRAFT_878011 [Athelia psychrophila]|uniref:Uncharacterized protein n=1 Tax=Athelia psychrophila TaxID=1759441 RepID=A0A167VF91_9AGAM|nr:hypothetical protein FIBSPDRAFT_878011 [Fibularhizoctonia sp. CBS 109695]